MINFTISEEDKQKINQERFCCPDPLICRRLHALHLKGMRKSHQEISDFVGLSLNTLTRLFKKYANEGLSAIRMLNYTHKRSPLEGHREELRKHFDKTPPASVKQARDDIERITGIKKSVTRVRIFLHQLGMAPRKVGGIPTKADPGRQEEFKKKAWNQS
jgi:transposase